MKVARGCWMSRWPFLEIVGCSDGICQRSLMVAVAIAFAGVCRTLQWRLPWSLRWRLREVARGCRWLLGVAKEAVGGCSGGYLRLLGVVANYHEVCWGAAL